MQIFRKINAESTNPDDSSRWAGLNLPAAGAGFLVEMVPDSRRV